MFSRAGDALDSRRLKPTPAFSRAPMQRTNSVLQRREAARGGKLTREQRRRLDNAIWRAWHLHCMWGFSCPVLAQWESFVACMHACLLRALWSGRSTFCETSQRAARARKCKHRQVCPTLLHRRNTCMLWFTYRPPYYCPHTHVASLPRYQRGLLKVGIVLAAV